MLANSQQPGQSMMQDSHDEALILQHGPFLHRCKQVTPTPVRNPRQPPLESIIRKLAQMPKQAANNPEVAQLVEDSQLVYEGLARLRAGPHQGSCLADDLEALAVELHTDGNRPCIPLPAGSRRRAHDIFRQRSIIKEFNGVMHLGTIMGLDGDAIFQHVQYADGDSEDLEDHEILEMLAAGPFNTMAFTSCTGDRAQIRPGDYAIVSLEHKGEYPCRVEEIWLSATKRESYAIVRKASLLCCPDFPPATSFCMACL